MKNVTRMPGPSCTEYLFILKMRPLIVSKKEKGKRKKGGRTDPFKLESEGWLERIEHEATIKTSAKTLHHETVF
jgi:hypothetical protein